MVGHIAEVRGWRVEEETWTSDTDAQRDDGAPSAHGDDWGVVRRLEANWRAFQIGGHKSPAGKPRKKKKVHEWLSSSDGEGRD